MKGVINDQTKELQNIIELDEESQAYFRNQYPSLSDCRFFSIECRENPEIYAKFASYTGSVVLLEPFYMRDKLTEMISSAAEKYRSI